MDYKRKDHYFQKAKKEGYSSRAAYKLLEMNRRFRLARTGDTVVDLGCSPGGWIQVLEAATGKAGYVVAVDRAPFEQRPPASGFQFIHGEIMDDAVLDAIHSFLGGGADLVVSDLSPDLTGIRFRDAYNSYVLALRAWEVCRRGLKGGGHFVVKIFPGEETVEFASMLRLRFRRLSRYVPKASRKGSSETYLVANGFRRSS